MEKVTFKFLEKEIYGFIIEKLGNKNLIPISNIRCFANEFDIIFFNRETLELINIEVKRGDWKYLLDQTLRGKMYCHYSIALLPIKYKDKIPLSEFEKNGVGLFFYEEKKEDIDIDYALPPKLSESTNRYLKKSLYKYFYDNLGELIYA